MSSLAALTPSTPAKERLCILILEDDPLDAAMIRRALTRAIPRASVRWARTRDEFVKALTDFLPELVISDYRLPAFGGLSALSLVRERASDIPFIMISDDMNGEETAVEALNCGATDFLLKGRLERLEIVATRVLREREDRVKADAALLESQAKLLESQKMEALGRLSGGIAHDFNNILTAITGYSELTLLNPTLAEGVRADIQEILNAACRATALTRQLLAFNRRQIFAPQLMDLNCHMAELDRMLQRIIGEDIKLAFVPASDLMKVRVDADQFGQVILNLVVNARDAMPKGGTLTLRTTNVELKEEDLRAQPDRRPGRYVRLAVEDSGEGMDAETLSRIFEPFFTTKSKDKGTGLGLATVYGIVKQSDGFIEVESRRGVGSVFRVYLPGVGGELDAVRKPPAPETLRGSENILVVDDDDAVGLVARRILESQGYTVIAARGGEEALRRCADSNKPVDLLVTDVVMRGINGQELARRLMATRPACKVLFFSGYAEGGITEFAAMKEHFISKPFSASGLIKKVRQTLDSPCPERLQHPRAKC